MRSVWVEQPGGLAALVDRDIPRPEPGPGEVRVRVVCAGFNPVDAAWRRGEHLPPLPGVIGRDFSGVVDALGEGIESFRVGDPVLGYAGGASHGTYAEYVCLRAPMLGRMPAGLGFELAAALPVAGLTAQALLERIPAGASIFVTGAAGAVGVLLLLQHRARPRRMRVATSSAAGERELTALDLGAEQVVRLDRVPPERWRDAVLDGMSHGWDCTVDLAGGAQKRLCFESAAAEGQVLSIVEEPPDFALNLWDERSSPLIQRGLGFRFVQLSARLRYESAGSLGWYGEAASGCAALAAWGALEPYARRVEVLGSLSAETARAAHARLESRTFGKWVMRVGEP